MSRQSVSSWETGRAAMPAAALIRWAEATRVSLDWIAWGNVRPEGFEPPTYWSGVNIEQRIDTAIALLRTHIARDLDYDTAEDQTISAVWQVLYGVHDRDFDGSLEAFGEMWVLLYEIAADTGGEGEIQGVELVVGATGISVEGALAGGDLLCDQCGRGLTFSTDGDRWCWSCDPEVTERMTYSDDQLNEINS